MSGSPPAHLATEPLWRGLISVKGVVWHGEALLLVLSRRGEWELPGGKLRLGEPLEECLRREFCEEVGVEVAVGPLLGVASHHVHADILVLTYGCFVTERTEPQVSDEHDAARWWSAAEFPNLPVPTGYRVSAAAWRTDPRRAR